MSMNDSINSQICKFIAEMKFQDLPQESTETIKRAILDCLGVAIAGSSEICSKILEEYVAAEKASPDCSIIGGGFKTSDSLAAWVNGTKAHALDYDDVCLPVHPTAAILPAVLALSEKYNFSGKDLMLAYLCGFEVELALAELALSHVEKGWHVTSTFGTVGATVGCCKLLRMKEVEIRNAIGIAASLCSGLRKNFGTMTKPMHAGNAARNGVIAARLASAGWTADQDIFEGNLGFFGVFGQTSNYPKDLGLKRELRLLSRGIAIKPYPSCAATHAGIEAAIDLRRNFAFKVDDIAQVFCATSSGIPNILIHHRPKTPLEAKFSLEFCVAVALVEGKVGVEHFTERELNNPTIRDIMDRVTYVHPESMGKSPMDLATEVKIKLVSGIEYSKMVNTPKGDPRNPLSWDEVVDKFRNCTREILARGEMERAIEIVSHLEKVNTVSDLMQLLVFKKGSLRSNKTQSVVTED
ncbi:MAG: MmgE/PrpD family protein [Candidatus Bathyarchaeia archaeon]